MELDQEDSNALNFWQSLHFEALNPNQSSKSTLHSARVLFGQLAHFKETNKITDISTGILYNNLFKHYAADFDQKEINGFVQEASNSSVSNENERKQWQSGLSFDRLSQLPWFQQFLKDSEIIHNNVFHDPMLGRILKCKPPNNQYYTNNPSTTCSSLNDPQQNVKNDIGSNPEVASTMFKRKDPNLEQGQNFYASLQLASNLKANSRKIETNFGTGKESEYLKDDLGAPSFLTAREQLAIEQQKKYGPGANSGGVISNSYGTTKKSLGTRRGLNSRFVPPILNKESEEEESSYNFRTTKNGRNLRSEDLDERLKSIDPKMIELIQNEIMDYGPSISWDDIAGLEFVKDTIKEIVIWPMLRPDIFTGLRGPAKGILLFGPPGTGKTLIGKCIASQSKATFFSISASSLTSKWVGEGEKMVRALFAVARTNQPSVIFIDEIDSLLTHRTEGEHEASRRIKTEFLVQLDGATTSHEDRLLVIGATNRPQEIDEAARRRFVKRLYIPLPNLDARKQIVQSLLIQQNFEVSEKEFENICQTTEGYSGADMANVCREAALGPIRSISFHDIQHISPDQVRPIIFQDFLNALHHIRPSVSEQDLNLFVDWNIKFGCRAVS